MNLFPYKKQFFIASLLDVFEGKAMMQPLLVKKQIKAANYSLHSGSEQIRLDNASLQDDSKGKIGLKLGGQVGGPTQAIAVEGNFAYMGVGMRLIILDVTNPAHIRQVGSTLLMNGFVICIAISKKIAYVTSGGAGLYVVNISNPMDGKE